MENQTNDNGFFMSPTIGSLAGALAKFQGSCPEITKECTVKVTTRNGGSYTFQYASLDNIIRSVKAVLSENGLSVTQLTSLDGSLTTILLHSSGEYISSRIKIAGAKLRDSNPNAEGMSPQEYGSAITYMRRYAYTAILGLSTEEDDDGNHASGNTAEKTVAPTKWLNQGTAEWKEAVGMLESGKSLADVKALWKVNKDCEALLSTIKPKPAKKEEKPSGQAQAKSEKPLLISAEDYGKILKAAENMHKAEELFGVNSEEHKDCLASYNVTVQSFDTFYKVCSAIATRKRTVEQAEEKYTLLPEVKEYLKTL